MWCHCLDVCYKIKGRSDSKRKMPLPVTEDTPPDMLAGSMDIRVLLPSGRTVNHSVERSTPMMDVLVAVTTAHKLSPAAHSLTAFGEFGAVLHHLPNTPLGALDTRLFHLNPKNNATLRRAPSRPTSQQPFQATFRLQVHLPRNQLFVTRVGADTKLRDVLHLACAEKNLDPEKFEMRHPANLQQRLSPSHSLGDYRLQEVTMVSVRPPGASHVATDIMALHREQVVRRHQVKATGNTAYPAVFGSSTHVGPGSVSSDGRSVSPAASEESRSLTPPAPDPPKRPGRKRRPAPKPPVGAVTSHSRTSSDSSGYHEASVLSEGAETRPNGDSLAGDTLPRRSKLASESTSKMSQSMSNLATINTVSTATLANRHSASTASLSTQGLVLRKKKAAPAPPCAPARRPVQVQPSVQVITESNEAQQTPPRVAVDEVESVHVQPSVQVITESNEAQQTPPRVAVDEVESVHVQPSVQVITESNEAQQTPPRVAVEEVESVHVQPSVQVITESNEAQQTPPRVAVEEVTFVQPAKKGVSTVVDINGFQREDAVDKVLLPVEPEFVVPLESLPNVSDELPAMADWEYTLPAPPTAFRDSGSPDGTVVLEDAHVFLHVEEMREASPEPVPAPTPIPTCSVKPATIPALAPVSSPTPSPTPNPVPSSTIEPATLPISTVVPAPVSILEESWEPQTLGPRKFAPDEHELRAQSKALTSRRVAGPTSASSLDNFSICSYSVKQGDKPLLRTHSVVGQTVSRGMPVKRATSFLSQSIGDLATFGRTADQGDQDETLQSVRLLRDIMGRQDVASETEQTKELVEEHVDRTEDHAEERLTNTFVYRGPPSINFGAWSERPKVQVSLKSDKDYRIGGSKPALRRFVEDNVLAQPKPLTMRIVSETFKPSNEQVTIQEDRDRLPVVRGVELKKPVQPTQSMEPTKSSGGHQANMTKRFTSVVGVNGAKPMPTVKGFVLPLKTINGTDHDFRSTAGWRRDPTVKGFALNTEPTVKGFALNTEPTVKGFALNTEPTVKGFALNTEPTAKGLALSREPVVQGPTEPTVKGLALSREPAVKCFDLSTEPTVKGLALSREPAVKGFDLSTEPTVKGLALSREPAVKGFDLSAEPTAKGLALSREPAVQGPTEPAVKGLALPPQATATVLRFKKPVQRPLEHRFTNPRDALMDAIKNFGGQDALKLKHQQSE